MAIPDPKSQRDELKQRVRHNHAHHPPKNDDVVSRHEFIRQITADLGENLIDTCPISRELSMALTHLEEVMTWANAAVARNTNYE